MYRIVKELQAINELQTNPNSFEVQMIEFPGKKTTVAIWIDEARNVAIELEPEAAKKFYSELVSINLKAFESALSKEKK